MRVKFTTFLAFGPLFALVGHQPTLASPTLAGSTGLIKTPTADTLREGSLQLGFSWVGGKRSYLFRPKTNRNYYATMGILPGLEVSLDQLQVIGWYDPTAPGVAHAIHRLSNVKYRLPLPDSWPQIALGAQDPLSANLVARGPAGQTRYGLTTYYAVMDQSFGPVSFHAGYGNSSKFIQGVFGGVDWRLGGGMNVRVEHDSEQWNAGLHWQPVDWFSLQAARLFPDEWAYGFALSWSL